MRMNAIATLIIGVAILSFSGCATPTPRVVSIAADNSGSVADSKSGSVTGLQMNAGLTLDTCNKLRNGDNVKFYVFSHRPELIRDGKAAGVKEAVVAVRDGLITPGAAPGRFTYLAPVLAQFAKDAQSTSESWTGFIFSDGDLYDPGEMEKAAAVLAGMPNVSGIAIGPVILTGGYRQRVEAALKPLADAGKLLVWNTASDKGVIGKFLRETRKEAK